MAQDQIGKGYYLVKHYNYETIQIMFFNGKNFEGFKSDKFIHDEIEWYKKINLKKVIQQQED